MCAVSGVDLNRVTRPRLLQMLAHTMAFIMVYYQRRFVWLTISEYSGIMRTVRGKAIGPTR
jgi:hypothetical protein